jgi:hypothetical protein
MKRDLSHLSAGLTVLVEEDTSIQQSWIEFFEKCGLKLLVFDSAKSFISGFQPDGEPVEFFFDQDFGTARGVGLKLAAYVQTWPGRTGTSLVTAYPPEWFEAEINEGVIDAVRPKFPEEIFGEDYHGTHVRRRIAEEGVGRFFADSVGKISDAFDRFELAVGGAKLAGRSRGVGA